MQLKPSSLTLTPDLRFESDEALGDVKYKLMGTDWNRGDLYQAVAFGTAFHVNKVMVVGFSPHSESTLPPVRVGAVEVTPLWWRCHQDLTPEQAGDVLCKEVLAWLDANRAADWA